MKMVFDPRAVAVVKIEIETGTKTAQA